jgi:hypothetical protein
MRRWFAKSMKDSWTVKAVLTRIAQMFVHLDEHWCDRRTERASGRRCAPPDAMRTNAWKALSGNGFARQGTRACRMAIDADYP